MGKDAAGQTANGRTRLRHRAAGLQQAAQFAYGGKLHGPHFELLPQPVNLNLQGCKILRPAVSEQNFFRIVHNLFTLSLNS